MVLVEQATPGYLPDSFIQDSDRNQAWSPIFGRQVAVGCGDDRPVTSESAMAVDRHMVPGTMSLEEGFASIYGGRAGLEQTLLVAGTAAHGETFIDTIGGFTGAKREVSERLGTLGLLHSAEANEGGPHAFSEHQACGVGCAYCELFGVTAYYLDADPSKPEEDLATISHIMNVARADQAHVFGTDAGFEQLVYGKQSVARHLGTIAAKGNSDTVPDARNFSVSRSHFAQRAAADGTLIPVLAGNHASAPNTGLILNFDTRTVGSANRAAASGRQIYRSDVVHTSAAMGPVLQDYAIPPELFARAVVLDTAPVRAALVSHDSDPDLHDKLDPTPLAIGVRGDVQEGLNYLQRWR